MSRFRHFVALATVVLCTSALTAQTGDRGRTFVFLSNDRPMVIRLHCTINGKALDRAWKECMAVVFQRSDRNNNGVLDEKEAGSTVAPSMIFGGSGGNIAFPDFGDLDSNDDGVVSLREFEAYYENNGGGAFRFTFLPGGAVPWNAGYLGIQQQTFNADAINKKLIFLLDANGDKKLDKREMKNAAAILQRMDTDDDGMIALTEINPLQIGNPVYLNFARSSSSSFRSGSYIQQRNQLFQVDTNLARRSLADEIILKYGKNKKRLFTAKDLRLADHTFAKLDRDRDGFVDSEELLGFADCPPDLEFDVLFDKDFVLQRRKTSKTSYPATVSDGGESLTFDVGMDRIMVGRKMKTTSFGVAFIEQNYLAQLANADMDGNGYLDEIEARKNAAFRNTFSRLDADGDGKLFAKELTTFLRSIRDLQKKAAESSVSMSFSAQGFGLFDVADTRPDGRLGLRELRGLTKLVGALDKNGDGCLELKEIPRNYQVLFEKAGNQNNGTFVVFGGGVYPNSNKQPIPPSKGPTWFRKMDVNQDGDVSPSEFLGSSAMFRSIDTDGDGLIDAIEAQTASRRR